MVRTGHQIRDRLFRNKGMSASLWEELGQTLDDPIFQRFIEDVRKHKIHHIAKVKGIEEVLERLRPDYRLRKKNLPNSLLGLPYEVNLLQELEDAAKELDADHNWDAYNNYPIDTVWKAQGVRLYAKFDLFQASELIEVKDPEYPRQSTFTAYGWPGIDSTEIIPLLNVSEIVLWHQEPLETSTDMPLPTIRNINKDLMISDAMFMVWPYPHDATQVESIDDNLTLREGRTHWQLLVDGGEFLLNVCHLDTYEDDVQGPQWPTRNHQYIYLERIPYGQYTKEQLDELMQRETVDSLRDKERSESEMQSDDAIYKMLTFLNMKVADIEERKVERSVRKQIKRNNPDRDYSPINIVKLRRVMYKGSAVPTDIGTESTFEYKGRFWVRGHWTQQPYGKGRKLRRPQYIDPYIKGPEDKPMIEKAYVVAN